MIEPNYLVNTPSTQHHHYPFLFMYYLMHAVLGGLSFMYWLLRNIRVTTYDRNSVITRDPNKNTLCRREDMCTKTDGHKTGSTPNPSGETIRTYPDQSKVWVGYRFREEDLILLDKLAHSALLCFLGWHERLSFPCTDSSAFNMSEMFLSRTRSPSSAWRHKLDGGC